MTAKGSFSLMLFFGTVLVSVALLALVLTSPTMIGPVGVTVWFLVLFAALSMFVSCGLYWYKTRSPKIENTPERLLANSQRQGWLIGGGLVALLALSSLRQLSLRDAGLIAALLVLLEVFLRSRQ